jgi:tRNA-specific 2-thiouridylase
MSERTRVVVALSGGVDSSVAAALLVQQGYQVIGMMMRLWSEPGSEAENRCCTPDAMAQARRVSALLGIPFYAIDAQERFHETVVQAFIDGYQQNQTPNPCLFCNRLMRWGFLLERARALGAQYMATGHYARLGRDEQGRLRLLRGLDPAKDQSYVLHALTQEQLAQTLFPLGEMQKSAVRQLARDLQLPVAERAESQDLCFLGAGSTREFLRRNAPQLQQPGPILNQAGQALGQHAGLAFYTIGQRKGLGIAAPAPLYVLEKDRARNALVVGPLEALGTQELLAGDVRWVSGQAPEQPLRAQVKIRYKAKEAEATLTPLPDGSLRVRFEERLRDITPGQAAVFYNGEVCLGGGLIRQA